MSEYAPAVDVATSAELRRLVEQVQQTRQPVPLTQGGEVVAVLQPVPASTSPPPTRPHPEVWTNYDPARVLAGLRASAGALAGVDRDTFLADLRAQRGQASQGRPGH
jgi:hypothetical protein